MTSMEMILEADVAKPKAFWASEHGQELKANSMRRRIKKVFGNVKGRLDVIVLKNSVHPHVDMNFFYVTGLTSGLFEESIAILRPDLSLHVITSQLEEQSARRGREMEISVFRDKRERKELLREGLGRSRTIGVDKAELISSDYDGLVKDLPSAKFRDVSGAFGLARLVKDPDEIELVGRAARIASKVLGDPGELVRPRWRECELAAEVNYLMQRGGATSAAFETIVAVGPNSAEAHYVPGAKRVRKGESVLIDTGANYLRYCSDITRTYVPGKASRTQREMFETVMRAREAALKEVHAGVKGKDVHMAAQELIDRTKFKGRFTHGLGHGIGLSIHDNGRLAPKTDISLRSGMIFTIEPGIYLPGYGGVRIEDDILVTKNGYRFLTNAPITLEI